MSALRTTKTLLLALAVFINVNAGNAHATLLFTEDFSGTTLDPAWTLRGEAAGHLGLNGSGQYRMKDARDGQETALRRSTNNDPSSFVANIDVSLSPFQDPNTQTDFNWRFFSALAGDIPAGRSGLANGEYLACRAVSCGHYSFVAVYIQLAQRGWSRARG